jgi:pimeloyl-ACP methyl ester carboxylesterase
MMKFIGDRLENFRITIIDFPGFGDSSEPPFPWTVSDYTDLLYKLVKELKIKKPIIMGHSFGGRVAIKYASMYDVEKLVLFASPFNDNNDQLSTKTKILKGLKRLPGMNKIGEFMKNFIGSSDYKKASPTMRQVLVNAINEDLSNDAKKIVCPTLLIWGTNDEAVPVSEAKKLEKLIDDAALIVLPGTHYAYIENIDRVMRILDNFLEDNK